MAPAANADTAIAAIDSGADAVYIGPAQFGARAAAGNSTEDIARVVDYAHRFDAHVYATVNTILFDDELSAAERLIRDLYKSGVDALIVQDMGILRLDLPPIALHASTQCDTRTVEKARFLERVGFSQIVLARELSATEIKDIRQAVNVDLECFIHGALCVSYSGRCHASCAATGRSANRGECAQICRQTFDLVTLDGTTLTANRHLLSLRDFNQSRRLEQLIDCGVSSLKIEGRLKDINYVKNVTSHYDQLLNDICRQSSGRLRRRAIGEVRRRFEPDVEKSFNRRFTNYFFDGRENAASMSSPLTPKTIGEKIGRIRRIDGRRITIDTGRPLANGDGLAYFDRDKQLKGFRVNKMEGRNVAVTTEAVHAPAGTELFRNFDKAFNDALSAKDATRRVISVDIACHRTRQGLTVEIADENGDHATLFRRIDAETAKSDQTAMMTKVFSKTGNSVYEVRTVDVSDISDLFIPASVLTELRRELISALDRTIRLRHRYDVRRSEDLEAIYPDAMLTYADNVSNRLARQFYTEHGVTAIEPAMELSGKHSEGDVLMTTRFCLRREYGCCLRTPTGKKWPTDLILRSGNITMRVEFDCKNCQMRLHGVGE